MHCGKPQGPLPRKAGLLSRVTRNTHRCGQAGPLHPPPNMGAFLQGEGTLRTSTLNPSEMQRKVPPQRQKTCNRASSTRQVNKMVISEEQMKLPSTKEAELPTWAQLKKLTQLAEKSLKKTRVTQTPENMLLAVLMIVSTVSTGVSNSSEETETRENGP
nr:endogenous retrovirus group K member 8 Rec protein-like [Pan troglodytes]